MPPAYEVLLLNTAIPQIQAAQAGDTYVVPRDIAFSAALTLSAGTANGVMYLNGSKAVTTGSALTFDGTNPQTTGIWKSTNENGLYVAPSTNTLGAYGTYTNAGGTAYVGLNNNSGSTFGGGAYGLVYYHSGAYPHMWYISGAEKMRLGSATGGVGALGIGYTNLTSVGDSGLAVAGNVGIGTSSPAYKLDVASTANIAGRFTSTATTTALSIDNTNANNWGSNLAIRTNGTAAGYFGTIGSLLGNTTQDLAVYANTGNAFRIYTNGNNFQAIVDTSGNLGLGGAPSAWGASIKALEGYQSSGSWSIASGGGLGVALNIQNNAYYDGSNWIYKGSLAASNYYQQAGAHVWRTAASGTAGDAISFTQAMTLDASGNLLVGATTQYGGLKVQIPNNQGYGVQNAAGNGLAAWFAASSSAGFSSAGDYALLSGSSGLLFATGTTERARIDSSGNFNIGGTQSGAGKRLFVQGVSATSSDYALLATNSDQSSSFYVRNDGYTASNYWYANTTGSAANAYIDGNGGLARSTSSLKYKKNVQDAVHGLVDVLKLRAVTYEGKAEIDDGKTFGGLIAEEVHAAGLTEFVQYAEDGTPDALAYGNMVSLAFKAIQEQQAMINELKAEVAALKGA